MFTVIGLVISCLILLLALGLLLWEEYWPLVDAWLDSLGEINVITDDDDVESWI